MSDCQSVFHRTDHRHVDRYPALSGIAPSDTTERRISFVGDMTAPSELVSALPTDCGAALIFVQQLSGGRETPTLLAASLTRRTTRPVLHAHGGLMAEHGFLYVIPPNATPTTAQ